MKIFYLKRSYLKRSFVLLALVSILMLSACKAKEEAPPEAAPTPLEQQEPGGFTMDEPPIEIREEHKIKMVIEVSDEIQNAWSAVKLEIIEKESGKSEIYEFKRGEEKAIKDTDLKVKVTHFIPNFTMGDGIMTSLDANSINPAVNMIVTEGGNEIWNSVIFAEFPDTHPFEHEKYVILINEIVPAEGGAKSE